MKIEKLIETKLDDTELDDLNPQTASLDDIAAAVKGAVEADSNGEKEITDTDALNVAKETQSTATEVGANKVIITDEDFEDTKIENKLTRALDESLAAAKKYFRRGLRGNANILVEGLPGSGKTAIVESWCAEHGITLVAVNATDPKLETSINGMPLRDVTAPEDNKIARVRDNVLDALLDPKLEGKCVLFVDEFNRQKQDQLRRPLMSLFNEKRNSDGTVDVSKNLLFSVICINPSGLKFRDKGTVELNDAEHNRFLHTLRSFDSNAESSLKYFKGWVAKRLLNLGIIPPNSKASANHNGLVGPTRSLSKDELEDAKEYARINTLATYILSHPEFSFDDRDSLDNLDQGVGLRKQLLTGRLFTDLINAAGGEKEAFLRLVDDSSDLTEEKIEMFHVILDNYVMDTTTIYKKYNLISGTTSEPEEEQSEVEDDDDLFMGSSQKSSGKQVKIPAVTEQEIRDALNSW